MAHAHHHGHGSHSEIVGRKLAVATVANVLVVVGELAIGLWSGSLALVGDALHNATDALALILALVAVVVARRPATEAKSYGYQRAGVLVAFINSAVLAAFAVFFIREAWQRLQSPREVETTAMML